MQLLNNILRVAIYEYRSILRSPSVLLVLAGGIFMYGMLYNYMYSPNVLHEVPVAIVDNNRTSLSRRFTRLLDATPQVRIEGVTTDIAEAHKRMKKNEVAGIVFMPKDFDKKVGKGEEALFIAYNNTASFLYYEALAEGFSGAMLALDDAVRQNQLVFLNSDAVSAITNTRSIGVQGIALYNKSGGYADYLLPSVLMLILFQTMLMVISMRCGIEAELYMRPLIGVVGCSSSWGRAVSIVIGKAAVYVGFYALFAIFLVGFLPLLFNLPHLANPLLLIRILTPYLFASAFFSLACSPLFKDSDAPLLFIAFFSVGLLFLSGISWPLELMPWPWRALRYLLPAPIGVLAFVKANSMGANISDINGEMVVLWSQCIGYFALACVVYKRDRVRS